MEEQNTPIEPRNEKTKLPLGIRFIANVAIFVFACLSCYGIWWIFVEIKRDGYPQNSVFYTLTFIVAFLLAVYMRKGIKFANYALGSLFIWMGYHVWHVSDDNPGLLDAIGYASIFIGCFFLLVRVIFRPAKEKTK